MREVQHWVTTQRMGVKFKHKWWNCNNAVVKCMEEGKVVLQAECIFFYKQM